MADNTDVTLPAGCSLTLLKNLRDGDIVWVIVGDEVTNEQMEILHTDISNAIETDVTLFVSPSKFVHKVQTITLSELMSLRKIVEDAIDRKIGPSLLGDEH